MFFSAILAQTLISYQTNSLFIWHVHIAKLSLNPVSPARLCYTTFGFFPHVDVVEFMPLVKQTLIGESERYSRAHFEIQPEVDFTHEVASSVCSRSPRGLFKSC